MERVNEADTQSWTWNQAAEAATFYAAIPMILGISTYHFTGSTLCGDGMLLASVVSTAAFRYFGPEVRTRTDSAPTSPDTPPTKRLTSEQDQIIWARVESVRMQLEYRLGEYFFPASDKQDPMADAKLARFLMEFLEQLKPEESGDFEHASVGELRSLLQRAVDYLNVNKNGAIAILTLQEAIRTMRGWEWNIQKSLGVPNLSQRNEKLRHQLRAHGTITPIPGDGNCLFASIETAFGGEKYDGSGRTLRAKVASELYKEATTNEIFRWQIESQLYPAVMALCDDIEDHPLGGWPEETVEKLREIVKEHPNRDDWEEGLGAVKKDIWEIYAEAIKIEGSMYGGDLETMLAAKILGVHIETYTSHTELLQGNLRPSHESGPGIVETPSKVLRIIHWGEDAYAHYEVWTPNEDYLSSVDYREYCKELASKI